MFSAPSAAIAQLDRASDYGSEGLWFDSTWLHHSQSEILTFFSGLPFICRFSGGRSRSTVSRRELFCDAPMIFRCASERCYAVAFCKRVPTPPPSQNSMNTGLRARTGGEGALDIITTGSNHRRRNLREGTKLKAPCGAAGPRRSVPLMACSR